MAQFRELEAFAQFASDLDEDTRNKLNVVIELLKLWSNLNIAQWQ